MLSLLLSLAPQTAAAELPQHTAPVQSLVSVEAGPLELTRLSAMDLDVTYVDLANRRVDIIADEADLAALERARLTHRVVTADLARWYAERSANTPVNFAGGPYGSWLSPAYGQGSMGGYYTFDQTVSVLDQLRAAYPNLISVKSNIGDSLQGDAIWMVRISDNPDTDENEPECRFDSLHHAREPQGMHTSLWFMLYLLEEYGTDPLATYLVNEREMYFVPVVNPDGYQYNQQIAPGGGGLWRKNRRSNGGGSFGVDLNRNYAYEWGFSTNGSSTNPDSETYRGTSATSEPEVQAMQAFIDARDFQTALSIHTYSNVWLSPWGYDLLQPPNSAAYDELGALLTEVNNYPYGPASILLYPANGVTIDYDQGVHGTYVWTPEIGSSSDGFWPAPNRIVPLAEDNLLALQRTALAAGAWVRVSGATLTDAGDGDGAFEPNELVELDVALRNSGLASSGPVSLTLSTPSAFATVVNGAASGGNLSSFSNGQSANPLSLQIAGNVPDETVIEFTVTVSYGGGSLAFEGSFEAGNRVILAGFDFESGGAQGWAVGNPNDASTGEWTRVDPIGTAAQPEDDHTPLGTTCWVTGQGSVGGSLGENDVDGGSTTLVSPAFDLAGVDSPRISYWRWYSNDTGGQPNADVFEIELSNNNGGSWTSVETVGPAGNGTSGGWLEVDVDVDSIFAIPSSQVRIRFIASDLGGGSIIEAAIDDVVVSYLDPNGNTGLGSRYCDPAVLNSTGNAAVITATGSDVALANDLTLTATDLPPNQFGYFLASETQAFIQNPGGSSGNLCVGGNIARFTNQVQSSGAGGTYAAAIDLLNVPANPVTAVTAGETWNFTSWYRDVVLGSPTSNFTDAVSITFQ